MKNTDKTNQSEILFDAIGYIGDDKIEKAAKNQCEAENNFTVLPAWKFFAPIAAAACLVITFALVGLPLLSFNDNEFSVTASSAVSSTPAVTENRPAAPRARHLLSVNLALENEIQSGLFFRFIGTHYQMFLDDEDTVKLTRDGVEIHDWLAFLQESQNHGVAHNNNETIFYIPFILNDWQPGTYIFSGTYFGVQFETQPVTIH
jgi:hypothetical protein